MPFPRNLILTLLGLTALCTLSAQSCEVSFGFSQSFSTAFFEAEYAVPEGHAITATSWNFGDGTTGTQLQPIHTYPFLRHLPLLRGTHLHERRRTDLRDRALRNQ
ncbi:MAG: hypothetical protein ACON34_10340 [Flavobacteriales bacterium]